MPSFDPADPLSKSLKGTDTETLSAKEKKYLSSSKKQQQPETFGDPPREKHPTGPKLPENAPEMAGESPTSSADRGTGQFATKNALDEVVPPTSRSEHQQSPTTAGEPLLLKAERVIPQAAETVLGSTDNPANAQTIFDKGAEFVSEKVDRIVGNPLQKNPEMLKGATARDGKSHNVGATEWGPETTKNIDVDPERGGIMDRSREFLAHRVDEMTDRAAHLKDNLGGKAERAIQGTKHMVERATESEQRMMDKTREFVFDKADKVAAGARAAAGTLKDKREQTDADKDFGGKADKDFNMKRTQDNPENFSESFGNQSQRTSVEDMARDVEKKGEDWSRRTQDMVDRGRDKVSDMAGSVKEKAKDLKDRAKESLSMKDDVTMDRMKGTSREMKDMAKESMESMSEQAKEMKDRARDNLENMSDKSRDMKDRAMENMSDKSRDMKDKAKDTLENMSDKSRDLKDKARDTMETMSDKSRELKDRAKESMSSVSETAASAKDKVKDLASSAKDTVHNVKENVKHRVQNLTGTGKNSKDNTPSNSGSGSSSNSPPGDNNRNLFSSPSGGNGGSGSGSGNPLTSRTEPLAAAATAAFDDEKKMVSTTGFMSFQRIMIEQARLMSFLCVLVDGCFLNVGKLTLIANIRSWGGVCGVALLA